MADFLGHDGWSWDDLSFVLDTTQAALDAVGVIPGLGEVADGLNGLISLGRGDYVGAGLSFVSMVPIFGDIVGKGGKITRYAVKYSDEAAVAMKELDNGASRIWSQTVVAPTSVGSRVAEQSAIRQRVLANLDASKQVRESSRFDSWAFTFDPLRMPRNAASTAFEARLPSSMYPDVAARLHFREANSQLLRAMDADAGFAQMMDDLIPGIRGQLELPRSISTRAPHGWTWHHADEAGLLQLVPSNQHWDPVLWRILHPDNKGGMAKWGGGY